MGWNSVTRTRWRNQVAANSEQEQEPTQLYLSFTAACWGTVQKESALDKRMSLFRNIVRTRMIAHETEMTDLFSALWASQSRTTYLDQQLEISTKLAELIRTTTAQTTIDDIVNQLFRYFNVDTAEANKNEDALRHLVFAAIGWCTMLYTATHGRYDSDFSTRTDTQSGDNSTRRQPEESSRRPLGALLRNHGLMPISCPPGDTVLAGLSTLLPVTHLNFFSLSKLGDVTISWVDDLSRHCEFDRFSRDKSLKLFRLPSLCARACLNGNEEPLLGW